MKLHTFTYRFGEGWAIADLQSAGADPALVIAFNTQEGAYQRAILATLAAAYPQATLLVGQHESECQYPVATADPLVVSVMHFDHGCVRSVWQKADTADEAYPSPAGAVMTNCWGLPGSRSILLLARSLSERRCKLKAGLQARLPQVRVCAGLNRDGSPLRLHQWTGCAWADDPVVAVAIGSCNEALHSHRLSPGHAIGEEWRITRAAGNVLYELNGKPALVVYRDAIGDLAAGLPATGLLYPLSIRANSNNSVTQIRTVLSVNEQNQSICFAGDIPCGRVAQLIHADLAHLIGGACANGRAAHRPPALALAMHCDEESNAPDAQPHCRDQDGSTPLSTSVAG